MRLTVRTLTVAEQAPRGSLPYPRTAPLRRRARVIDIREIRERGVLAGSVIRQLVYSPTQLGYNSTVRFNGGPKDEVPAAP